MKRISQLDGIRGIAILLVLIYHYFCGQIVIHHPGLLSRLNLALSLSWSGVDLFFVLSGFLIAGILLDHRDAPNYFRVFYIRRVCRIFPLYFLLLALFICLSATRLSTSPSFQWLFHNPMPLWSYASFTQNIFMGIRGDFGAHFLGVTWSLAVEEQFYLFVPFLIYFLPRRALLGVFFLAVLGAPMLRHFHAGLEEMNALVNTPWRSDSLLSGAALAVLVRSRAFVAAVQNHRQFLHASFIALLAGAAILTSRPNVLRDVHHLWFDHLWLACLYTLFILIAYLDTAPALVGLLQSRVLVWFGRLSYGIYMFHEAMVGLLHGFFRHDEPHIRNPADAAITLLALALTLLLAALSFRFFESPILRMGQRFQYASNRGSNAEK